MYDDSRNDILYLELNTVGALGYGVYRHFPQYYSCIVEVSFIGGGNRSIRRKPPTSHKLLKNLIT